MTTSISIHDVVGVFSDVAIDFEGQYSDYSTRTLTFLTVKNEKVVVKLFGKYGQAFEALEKIRPENDLYE